MTEISVDEAAGQLPALIEKAREGADVFLTKGGQRVAKLVALPVQPPLDKPREPGSAKGLIWMAEDFDAPLEDFAEYM